MKIRTRLGLSAVASAATAAILVATLFLSTGRVASLLESKGRVDDVAEAVFELDSLTSEFLLTGTERAREQWELRYASLGTLLSTLPATDAEERYLIEKLRRHYAVLSRAFFQLAEAEDAGGARDRSAQNVRNRRAAQILTNSLELVAAAKRLEARTSAAIRGTHERVRIAAGASALLMVAVVALILFYLARSLLRSTSALEAGAAAISRGELDYRIAIEADDELGSLARSLNTMAEKLEATTVSRDLLRREMSERERAEDLLAERTALAEENETRIRLLLDSTAEAIFGLDREGYCTFANPACARILGYRHPDYLLGEWIHPLIHHTHPDGSPMPVEECRVYQSFRRGEGTHVDDEVLWRADGTSFPVEYWSYPIRQGDAVVGAVVAFLDITERKQAEEQIRRTAEELARSNEELEHFAYVASHDLQEPLRKIRAFGDRLQTKCADALDEKGLDYLTRMQRAAERMQSLIEDLLAFSRVGTRTREPVPLDLGTLAREVVSDLEMRLEQTGGEVELGELPVIHGDDTQMRQLLQNLIGNALKFHREGEAPRVRVSARGLNGTAPGSTPSKHWEIVVEDNGIGFDERHAERIFTPFQRLHGRDAYEGTGIGLAICRKIARRHGGDVSARGEPGRGATFTVTLPAAPRDPGGNEA